MATAEPLPGIVVDDSIFAVITHKAGFAAGLAHDHLVSADPQAVSLQFDAAAPTRTTMEFVVAAEELTVDDPELRGRWSPRLMELEILEESLGELPEKDRGKIRKAMLGTKQLAAEKFPKIEARIIGVGAAAEPEGDFFEYQVNLALTVHGKTVTRSVSAGFSVSDGRVTIEAFGSFRFTDFEIKPYSALLGAVKNQDDFHVYARLSFATEAGP